MAFQEVLSVRLVVRDGIAIISQNKNRLTSFRRNVFVSGNFEPVKEPTNADAPDIQLV